MHRVLEDVAKMWLAERGLPVPRGEVAQDAATASAACERLGGNVVIKARIPIGRRGKAGVVRRAECPDDAARITANILGRNVEGHDIEAVLVEQYIDIASEYFLSFTLSARGLTVLASTEGGVEIETLFATDQSRVRQENIDPLAGLPAWRAIELWHRAGVRGIGLRPLGVVTTELYQAFRSFDAVSLELNPLAVTKTGQLSIVGVMLAVDEHASFRHPKWREAEGIHTGNSKKDRERDVQVANAALPGGESQYVELDGDIGLLVGGGGAGLYLHDMIVDMGGKPANHCVTPPTGSDTRKLNAVLRAILGNPRARSLLVGFNFAQMARADLRMQALADVLREGIVDIQTFPIVVRLFGAGEPAARNIAREFPNITYMPRGSSLHDAALEIVQLTEQSRGGSRL